MGEGGGEKGKPGGSETEEVIYSMVRTREGAEGQGGGGGWWKEDTSSTSNKD